jgi:hypothetical protein
MRTAATTRRESGALRQEHSNGGETQVQSRWYTGTEQGVAQAFLPVFFL